jgi:hypothetical protein
MSNWPAVISAFAAGGFGTVIAAPVKAFLGRRKAHVDSAEVVQGMALAMITPFEKRLKEAEAEVDTLRKKVRELNIELDRNIASRRAAEDELLRNGLPIPVSDDKTRGQ